MDWHIASAQVLRALRGRRSQRAFSRRIGYRSNVAGDWESGRRMPTAKEALRVCHKLKIDVGAAFTQFQPACAQALGKAPPFRVEAWLSELAGSITLSDLAARSGVSRFALARWLRGKTQPRLPDFLALVEAISGRASDLVQGLVAIEQVSELHEVATQRAAAKRLAVDEPWSAAVLRVLESAGYKQAQAHKSGYIADRLGIDRAQEADILARLRAAGVVRLRSKRFEVGEPLTVDTQTSDADARRLRAHWAAVGLDRTRAPRAQDWLGFNVISTSAQDLDRVREVLRRAFREIRAIAAASEPTESIALLNMHLVTWNEDAVAGA
jgi:transcriptional regulator with XRE-family HTH domain